MQVKSFECQTFEGLLGCGVGVVSDSWLLA